MRRSVSSVLGPVVAVLAAALALACSDKATHPPPSSDNGRFVGVGGGAGGGTVTDAGADGSASRDAAVDAADAGTCNDVRLNGLVVDRIGVIGDPPAMAGGTIADGSYDLTDLRVYVGQSGTAGPTGTSVQQTIRIAGGVIASVERIQTGADGGGFGPETRTSRSYTVQGTSLSSTTTCPQGGGTQQQNFTATDVQLVVVDPPSHEQYTFTKR